MPQAPVSQPLGPATVSGTTLTVDSYVNPPTRIPAIIRNLVAANEGYFAETIFNTPGFTVEGGAVLYEETFPTDHFLPDDQDFAPRAPGAEAPRLGATRPVEKIALPESWSGSIEVTDEARRRNKVLGVQRQFTQASNTLADRMQRRALETLKAAITSWGRAESAQTNWREAHAEGLINTDPLKMPMADFAFVQEYFANDKVGVQPDTVVLHPKDNYYLTVLYASYPNGGVTAMLRDFGINSRIVSPLAEEGDPIFVKAGAVGTIAFETPLSQEKERVGRRKTDVFILEATPVFVAYDASAVLQLTGVDS